MKILLILSIVLLSVLAGYSQTVTVETSSVPTAVSQAQENAHPGVAVDRWVQSTQVDANGKTLVKYIASFKLDNQSYRAHYSISGELLWTALLLPPDVTPPVVNSYSSESRSGYTLMNSQKIILASSGETYYRVRFRKEKDRITDFIDDEGNKVSKDAFPAETGISLESD